jgi:hypothetical protein
MLASGAAALLQIIVAPWPGSACGTADHGSARLRDPIYGRPMPTGFVPMGTRGAYRHDLAGVVSHIASLDRSDSLGNRCVVVACNFGAGNGLATACHVVLRFAGGDRSRRRRLIALLLRPRWGWIGRGCACSGNGAWRRSTRTGRFAATGCARHRKRRGGGVPVCSRWLTILPLIELVLHSRTAADSVKTQSRWRSLLVPVGALIITVTLVGMGVAVDRFDSSHPRLTHLMYLMAPLL